MMRKLHVTVIRQDMQKETLDLRLEILCADHRIPTAGVTYREVDYRVYDDDGNGHIGSSLEDAVRGWLDTFRASRQDNGGGV